MKRLLPIIAFFLAGSPLIAAGLLTPVDGTASLAIESQEIEVNICDGIAVTQVTQVFKNDSPRPLEAVYSFPLPPGASLSGFTMWIGGQEMVGEVLEKGRARKIYEEIVHPAVATEEEFRPSVFKKDPGLVEEVSYREFQVTIFPVPANGTQQVRLTYYQYLEAARDLIGYVYPLETRATENSRIGGRLTFQVTLRSSVPIASYSFPTIDEEQISVEVVNPYRINAYMERADGDLDRDFILSYRLGQEETGIDVVHYQQPGDHGYFMLVATAPTMNTTTSAAIDYTFVVDVSGSMRRQRKLEMVGKALARFLETCSPSNRFNAIAFNVSPEALSIAPLNNSPDNRDALSRFLGEYNGVGGTDLYPALELAYQQADPARQHAILVVSDGGLNDLEEDHHRFLQLAGRDPAVIFGLTVGNDANDPLLEALSRETGGFLERIASRDDLRRRGVLLRERMRQEPWRNLVLEVDGQIDLFDEAPASIPDLYPGRQIYVTGRYRGQGPAVFRLSGTRRGTPVALETTVDLRSGHTLFPEIRRMWAERKVHDLLQGKRGGNLPDAVDGTIVHLGEEYSIVTPLTSFLVLETEEMFQRYGINRKTHALLEEESLARRQRGATMDTAAENASRTVPPPVQDESAMDFGGAVDPLLLVLMAAPLAGLGILRRKK